MDKIIGLEKRMVNALTVDVEDAVSLGMRSVAGVDIKPTMRVYNNTVRLLELFETNQTKATFFILGKVAETFPNLIRRIADQGHELGIHGYSHIRYDQLSEKEVREEVEKSKKLVEDVSGKEVIGHRAPEFSINKKNRWVLQVLAEAGLKYDSSIFPVNSHRYGWPVYGNDITWHIIDQNTKIIETPMSSVKVFNKSLPACGGSYLRILPYWITDMTFKAVNKHRPVNLYLHPYEIDCPPFQDFYMNAIKNVSVKKRMKLMAYWYNRRTVVPKLSKLLLKYDFTTLQNVIQLKLNTEL